VLRAEDVRRDSLQRPRLHERDMLVRGGVEDDVGTMPVEQRRNPPGATDVCEGRHRVVEAVLLPKGRYECDEVCLSLVDEDELADPEPCQLGTERSPE
jgi:hypothetical protein